MAISLVLPEGQYRIVLTWATVNVYKGSVLVDTFEVPASGSGNAWYVFDIDADGVHEVNELIQYTN